MRTPQQLVQVCFERAVRAGFSPDSGKIGSHLPVQDTEGAQVVYRQCTQAAALHLIEQGGQACPVVLAQHDPAIWQHGHSPTA